MMQQGLGIQKFVYCCDLLFDYIMFYLSDGLGHSMTDGKGGGEGFAEEVLKGDNDTI